MIDYIEFGLVSCMFAVFATGSDIKISLFLAVVFIAYELAKMTFTGNWDGFS